MIRKISMLALFLGPLLWLMVPPSPFPARYSTVLTASDGTLLGALAAPDGQWRFPPRTTVPARFAKAIVCFEDHRFRRHSGVDFLAMGRAVLQNVRAGRMVSGGSTLTMQVVRLSRPEAPRSIPEKMLECLLAWRLELHCSKDEILALYSSHAPFGGNVVGLDAAAWRYFGRDAADLSWAEAALLAVLPNAPSLVHLSRQRNVLLQKRNRLLERMCRTGILSDETLQLALAESLPDRPADMPLLAPHLLMQVHRTHPGQRVQSRVDAGLQTALRDLAGRYAVREAANHVHNLCMLVLDVATGQPLAYVGNVPGLSDAFSPQVDIVRAPRSSGSILKPFLYAAMLDAGMLTPDMLVPDIPFYHDGFSPQNFNKTFDGAVPAHRVLERSLNVPSARMLQQYGCEPFHVLLKQLGLTTLTYPAGHYGLSLVLGGAECSLWDVTRIYARMADCLNRRLIQPSDSTAYPLSPASIYLTFSALANLNRPEEETGWQLFSSSRSVAWKTGTSFGNRDAWAVGVTPQYAVGIWVGNASGEGRPELTGIHDAAPLLFDVFRHLPPTSWFTEPRSEMETVRLCAESGYRTTDICPHGVETLLPRAGVHVPACPFHQEVTVSRDSLWRVNTLVMPADEMRRVTWFVLPPAEAWYYSRHHSDYKPLPPVHPDAAGSVDEAPLSVIYPQEGSRVSLPLQADGRPGVLVVRVAHARPDVVLYYHLNGQYAGSSTGDHRLTLQPPAGECILTVVDDRGNRLLRHFTVVE